MNLSQAMQLHAAALRRRTRSPRTIKFYADWLTAFDVFNKHVEIETITLAQLRQWIDSLLIRKLSPNTVRGAAMTTKIFFRWCVREELIERSPADRLELPTIPKRAPDVLTTNDLLTLINDVTRNSKHPERDTALLCFWSESGCRIGEIESLTIADVQIEERYAVVIGKGNKQRWVFYGEASQQSLAEWLTVRSTEAGSLFRLTKSGVAQVLVRLKKRTGIKVHPHKMRRSAATLRAAKGMSARAMQDTFGWEQLATAQKYVAAYETMQQARSSNPLDGVNINQIQQ
jgi:site-specific recombinase XerD